MGNAGSKLPARLVTTGRGRPQWTHWRQLALALACQAAALAPGCVMPQHRAIATVVNTAVAGLGITADIAIAADNANRNSWHLFNKQAEGVASAMIVFGVFAELITLAAHRDDAPPPAAPADRRRAEPALAPPGGPADPPRKLRALDCASVAVVLRLTSAAERTRLLLEPTIAACEYSPDRRAPLDGTRAPDQ